MITKLMLADLAKAKGCLAYTSSSKKVIVIFKNPKGNYSRIITLFLKDTIEYSTEKLEKELRRRRV